MDQLIRAIEMPDRKEFPKISIGDVVKVTTSVVEGGKERGQIFEGTVIAMSGSSGGRTFTVRKISHNAIGVERIFPFNTPSIKEISVVRHNKIRRAKLYYIRALKGKKARMKEKRQLPNA
ncbi:50S ribosomal protein L19 [Athalassotoga sp.]|uniref:50S ribosomal protein L19 n=1 Tax=Athalassotoga sp. TaxID=2022597 RepID=UPI003D0155A2